MKKLLAATIYFLPVIAFAEVSVSHIAPEDILKAVSLPGAGSGYAGYLVAAHAFGVAAVAAIAVVMIVWGAIGIFGENVWGKGKGKERVQNALLGLLLAAGSYVILKTVSDSLLNASFQLKDVGADSTTGVAITSAVGTGAAGSATAGTSGNTTTNQGSNNWPGTEGEWADVNTTAEVVAWRNQYDDNMGANGIIAEGATQNADGSYTLTSRVTGYAAGETHSDRYTDAGYSVFGKDLVSYNGAGTYGTAAVDPSVIPYGSVIQTSSGWYIAGDIGSAVVNRTASSRTNPIVDTYGTVDGGTQSVKIYPYTGTKSYADMTTSERQAYISSLNYSR